MTCSFSVDYWQVILQLWASVLVLRFVNIVITSSSVNVFSQKVYKTYENKRILGNIGLMPVVMGIQKSSSSNQRDLEENQESGPS